MKNQNFRSVDTLSAQLHCHMDYFIYWRHANSTHFPYSSFALILSFLVSLFTFYDPKSHKILQFYCFQILLGKKLRKPWPPCPPPPARFAAPAKLCVISIYTLSEYRYFYYFIHFFCLFFLLTIIESILCILKLKWEKALYKVGLSFHLEQEILKNLIVHSFMAVLSLVLLLEKQSFKSIHFTPSYVD